MSDIASTPTPPYYAVVFTSLRTASDEGYDETAELMFRLAAEQSGYLGIEHARSELGITVCYWESLEAISRWRAQADHQAAQERGKAFWYRDYRVRVCRVDREYGP